MSTRTLSLLVLIPTVLALTACGIERRQDRREDRREDRKDLVSSTSLPVNVAQGAAALQGRGLPAVPIG